MDPANTVLGLGSRIKLSDVIKGEMSAFSEDKETRRVAVHRMLSERGLGDLVQSVPSSESCGSCAKVGAHLLTIQ